MAKHGFTGDLCRDSRLVATCAPPQVTNIRNVWRTFHTVLKRLLVSDVIIRTCEGMTGVITILYVTNVKHVSVTRYGTLIATQMITSIAVYVPAGKIADRVGRKPFVIITFLSFAALLVQHPHAALKALIVQIHHPLRRVGVGGEINVQAFAFRPAE